jgi:hypothetical protein
MAGSVPNARLPGRGEIGKGFLCSSRISNRCRIYFRCVNHLSLFRLLENSYLQRSSLRRYTSVLHFELRDGREKVVNLCEE